MIPWGLSVLVQCRFFFEVTIAGGYNSFLYKPDKERATLFYFWAALVFIIIGFLYLFYQIMVSFPCSLRYSFALLKWWFPKNP